MKRRRRSRGVYQIDHYLRPKRFIPFAELQRQPDKVWIVCMRVSEGPPAVRSVRDACSQCGAVVWVARDTEDVMQAVPSAPLVCLHCWTAHLEEQGTGRGERG